MKNILRAIMIFALVFALISVVSAAAPNAVLKAIVVIEDDYEKPELNNISDSTNMDYGLVSKFLDTLGKQNVIPVEKTVLRGQTASYKNITTLLKNIKVSANDVIFFYFSGHGGMEKKNTFILTSENTFLYRSELESLIRAKPVRLSLVFTDACSSSIESVGGRGSFQKDSKERENAFIEIYKNLFYNYKGLLYMTAATEGEYAWGGKDGGSFTKSLFYEVLLQDPKLTWEDNFAEAKKRTQSKFNYLVNMGFLKPEDLKDLERKGIKSQTPKVYSMPTVIETVSIDNQTIQNQQNNNSTGNHTKNVQAIIKNTTQKSITFYIDNNVTDDDSWSWDNCVKKTIAAGKSLTLSDIKPLIVFFDNGKKKTISYQLTTGSYVFEDDKNGIVDMFTVTDKNHSNDSTADNSNNNNQVTGDNDGQKTNNGDNVGIGSIMSK
jgi:hypothetical protein